MAKIHLQLKSIKQRNKQRDALNRMLSIGFSLFDFYPEQGVFILMRRFKPETTTSILPSGEVLHGLVIV